MMDNITIKLVEIDEPLKVTLLEETIKFSLTDRGIPGPPGVDGIFSNPPEGMKKVVNIYVNSDGKLAVDYEQ